MSDDMPVFSDEERDLIRSSIRRLLEDEWPSLSAVEWSQDPRAVKRIWGELAALGVPDLGRNGEMGGLAEILLVFEEMGRACCPAPLLGAVISNLLHGYSEAVTDVAVPPPASVNYAVGFGRFDGDRAAGEVVLSGETISGSCHFVEGADVADRFVVFLGEPSGIAVVEAGASGVSIVSTPALSLPGLSSVHFDGSAALFLPVGERALRALVQIARLATAARALGSAQRGYELVVEHANTRKQFGKFIGQFQAVQHRLVDNLTRLDGARLTLEAAARAYSEKLETWSVFADLSVAHLNPGLRQLAIDMHQLMGAIGYSEEHELPRHFRQIHGNVSRFGGVLRARAEIGAYLVASAAQSSQ